MRAGEEPAEALEVLVLLVLLAVAVAGVQVDAVGVALPDLDQGVADRVALGVEDLPVRCVISPTAGVMSSLTMIRSLSVSSGSLFG